MSQSGGWRWIDPAGVERVLSSADLRRALQDGSVPRDAHVSREGFDGWVRAGDVPELFPRTLTPPPAALLDDVEIPPPPPPMRADVVPDARAPLTTLSGHAPVPDGAPALPPAELAPDAPDLAAVAPSPSPDPVVVVPTYATPLPPRLLPRAEAAASAPSARPPPASRVPPAATHPPPGSPRNKLLPAIAGAAVIGLVGFATWQFATPAAPPPRSQSLIEPSTSRGAEPPPRPLPPTSSSAPPSPSSSASASASGEPAPRPPASASACHATKPAVRLAARIAKEIPLEAVTLPKGARAVLGFSADGRAPQALSLDLATLGTKVEKTPRPGGKLRRVVPVASGAALQWLFDTDAPKSALAGGEIFPAEPPFQLGLAGGALATIEKPSDTPKRLWALAGGTLDAQRALSIPGEGTWIVARGSNAIFAGLMSTDRTARGDLAQLSEIGQVGPPAIATAAGELGVAFAWRAAKTARWSLRFTHGPATGPLPKAGMLLTPATIPGGEAPAPSLVGLPDGRWLIVWSEGPFDKELVRAVTLAPTGEAIGQPFTLSRPEQDGERPIALVGTGGVGAVAYVTGGKARAGTELWGAGVVCPLPAGGGGWGTARVHLRGSFGGGRSAPSQFCDPGRAPKAPTPLPQPAAFTHEHVNRNPVCEEAALCATSVAGTTGEAAQRAVAARR